MALDFNCHFRLLSTINCRNSKSRLSHFLGSCSPRGVCLLMIHGHHGPVRTRPLHRHVRCVGRSYRIHVRSQYQWIIAYPQCLARIFLVNCNPRHRYRYFDRQAGTCLRIVNRNHLQYRLTAAGSSYGPYTVAFRHRCYVLVGRRPLDTFVMSILRFYLHITVKHDRLTLRQRQRLLRQRERLHMRPNRHRDRSRLVTWDRLHRQLRTARLQCLSGPLPILAACHAHNIFRTTSPLNGYLIAGVNLIT